MIHYCSLCNAQLKKAFEEHECTGPPTCLECGQGMTWPEAGNSFGYCYSCWNDAKEQKRISRKMATFPEDSCVCDGLGPNKIGHKNQAGGYCCPHWGNTCGYCPEHEVGVKR